MTTGLTHFINGEVARAEQSEALSALSEDVENEKYLIHKALGRDRPYAEIRVRD